MDMNGNIASYSNISLMPSKDFATINEWDPSAGINIPFRMNLNTLDNLFSFKKTLIVSTDNLEISKEKLFLNPEWQNS